MKFAYIKILKVEQINKNDKSIDDLLLWNSRVTDLIAGASESINHL